MINLGRGVEWDPEEFDSVAAVIPCFKFGIVVGVLESKYARDVDEGGLREAVRDTHDYFLMDVVKKGHLGKKMDLLPAFRESFFVLQPHKLAFFAGSSQRKKEGEIKLDAQCRAESIPDSTSKSPLKRPGSKHHSKFQVRGRHIWRQKRYISQTFFFFRFSPMRRLTSSKPLITGPGSSG